VIPDAQWLVGAIFHRARETPRPWTLAWRRAQDLRIDLPPLDPNHFPLKAIGAGAFVALNGQQLHVVVVGWLAQSGAVRPLPIEDAYLLLLGLSITSRDLLNDIASVLAPSGPRRWAGWKGWIQPWNNSAPIEETIDFSRWERVGSTAGGGGFLLPEYNVSNVTGESFDFLVREWLLLFLASNGILHHEEDIVALRAPDWL
jgi:hypothetical protein